MVDGILIQIYNYEGRILCHIRLPGNVGESLNEHTADISNDVVVIKDRSQHSIIHLFSTQTGNVIGDGKYIHSVSIVVKNYK